MKKIIFDLECSQSDKVIKFHGGGEYTKTVFEHLVKSYSDICQISAFYNPNEFCDQWIFDLIKEYSIRLIAIHTIKDVEEILCNEHFDIFYCGLVTKYKGIQLPPNIVKICTLHGLRGQEYIGDFYSHYYVRTVIQKAKWLVEFIFPDLIRKRNKHNYLDCVSTFNKMVCVSKHTYYSLMINMPEISKKVCRVCYTPWKHMESNPTKMDDLPKKFILMISGNRAEKNCARAIKALDEMYSSQLLDYKTVITGNVPTAIRRKIKNKENFVLLDYVSLGELEMLYSKCALFLYPSLNEGFGMPPEEAMRYGKTCIVSAVCSLPEIYGNAVYYVNPYDIGEIKNRIIWALHEPIDERIIKEKIETLQAKQKKDLDFLCKMIAGISQKDKNNAVDNYCRL